MTKDDKRHHSRRNFIRTSAGIFSGLALAPQLIRHEGLTPADEINIIGPVEGFSPQVGTLVSMMRWMQDSLLVMSQGLSVKELDYLHDSKANTIGSLLLHIGAIEVYYQDLTFYRRKAFSEHNQKKWGVAMNLGEEAQKQIKSNPLDYYLSSLKEVRELTLSEFRKRDDQWLALVDPSFFGNQPTNNYCKWFHVCEHIANHRGQITWIRRRLPGAKARND